MKWVQNFLSFLKILIASLLVFAIQFFLLDFLAEDYTALLSSNTNKQGSQISNSERASYVWFGEGVKSNKFSQAAFLDPSYFADPSLRNKSIMNSPILQDRSLHPDKPTIPESSIIDYPLQPGVELITKRKPESISLPKLNKIASSKLDIPVRFKLEDQNQKVIGLPYEISGDLSNEDLIDHPDEFLVPPINDEAIAKISLRVTAQGFVEGASIIESTQNSDLSGWLIKQVKRCRFKNDDSPASLRNAVLSFYWLPAEPSKDIEMLPKN